MLLFLLTVNHSKFYYNLLHFLVKLLILLQYHYNQQVASVTSAQYRITCVTKRVTSDMP